MAKQTINIGASPNDGTGTPLRTSFDYCNLNFTELYTATGPSGNNIVVPGTATITGDLTVDTSTLKVDSANHRVGIGTASPARPLDIVGSFQSSLGWVLTGTPAGLGAGTRYIGGASTTDSWYYNGLTGGSHIWAFGESTAMTLNSTGLGVGTASHSVKLGVVDTVNTFAATFRGNGGTNFVAIGTTGLGASINGYTAGFAAAADLVLQPNGGNVGIGVAPSAWGSQYRALQIFNNSSLYGASAYGYYGLLFNGYNDNTNIKAIAALYVGEYRYELTTGAHKWFGTTANATAGATATPVQSMTLDASGRLILLASTTTPATLATNGELTFTATSNTNLRFSYRGSDGTTRVANITLA